MAVYIGSGGAGGVAGRFARDIRASDLETSWKLYEPFLHSPQQKAHPVGWQPPQMWVQTIAILHKYGGVKKDLNPTDYYTNAYFSK